MLSGRLRDGDLEGFLSDVRTARAVLPAEHRSLLEQIGVQETVIEDWPDGVQDLYRTIGETPPVGSSLLGALAVWLNGLRLVAFNGPCLRTATRGLSPAARKELLAAIAWHEYGHALSFVRSTAEQRREGIRLLEMLPTQMRGSIDYPGSYRRSEVFDEVIATVYAVMVARYVRSDEYGRASYLPPEVFEAFKEVIPWPPSR